MGALQSTRGEALPCNLIGMNSEARRKHYSSKAICFFQFVPVGPNKPQLCGGEVGPRYLWPNTLSLWQIAYWYH